MASTTIKAIEASTVHQIQSGQVIVDLCSVAKELVENGLDAGATSIDVRFKNQGLDSIEVQDNGSGIAPQNYESLALKHYTSKLSTYDDLNTLQTFGFRGEALSSLCALSRFTVVTCLASSVPRGTKLEFETSGRLKSTSVVAAQRGTTVVVENLFQNLPVRRRELERNIKREWGKVVSLLNQYACIQTGVKFTVSQQPTKGKRIVLFATKGNPLTRDNIINVFGAKTMSALIPLDLLLELELTTTRPKLMTQGDDDGGESSNSSSEIRIRGHVSRPAHGEGRQTPDRQMFYVNGRPCQLPQFAKVFNEVYKSYNTTQSPFIFADIQLDTHLYDVNVSPDKRTILLHDQGKMLDNLRESLIELFEKQDITVPISQLSAQKQNPLKRLAVARHDTPASEASSASDIASKAQSRVSEEDDDSDEVSGEEEEEEEEGDAEENAEAKTRKKQSQVKRSISSKSLSKDSKGLNLLSRWVRRSPERTTNPKPNPPLQHASADTQGEASREKGGEVAPSESGLSPVGEQPEEQGKDASSPAAANQAEADLQNRAASPGPASRAEEEPTSKPDDPLRTATEGDDGTETRPAEEPIPAITTPRSKSQTITSSGVVVSRPPKRPSHEVATITVGDETIVTGIGSSWKRQKVDDDAASQPLPTKAKPSKRSAGPLPSFGGRLKQMFSASGQQDNEDEDVGDIYGADSADEEDEEVDEVDDVDEEEEVEDEEEEGEQEREQEKGEEEEEGEEGEKEDDDIFVSGSVPLHLAEDEPRDTNAADNDEAEAVRVDEEFPSPQAHPAHDTEEEDASYSDREARSEAEPSLEDEGGEVEAPTDETPGEAARAAAAEERERRGNIFMKGVRARKKDATFQYVQHLRVDEAAVEKQASSWQARFATLTAKSTGGQDQAMSGLDAEDAEEKLSLIISKSDFANMRIVGQFNLGFILAVRKASGCDRSQEADAEANGRSSQSDENDDDHLFIIDQHASDEKYNFERLQATTIVQSQRLVHPKKLELTAVEEEIVMENQEALEANGFKVSIADPDEEPVGSRCQLLSLPLSRETTFSLADLEELIALLGEQSSLATTVPRPSRVRRMFAMRACRSSIMIGRALSQRQMEKVVQHMGEMEKPWNCPHGRPTMRHLCGLGGAWDERGWLEGDGFAGFAGWEEEGEAQSVVDWAAYLEK